MFDEIVKNEKSCGYAFFLGYEQWLSPSNPFSEGTVEHFDYEWGVTTASNEVENHLSKIGLL